MDFGFWAAMAAIGTSVVTSAAGVLTHFIKVWPEIRGMKADIDMLKKHVADCEARDAAKSALLQTKPLSGLDEMQALFADLIRMNPDLVFEDVCRAVQQKRARAKR